jgi:hypothetical protein
VSDAYHLVCEFVPSSDDEDQTDVYNAVFLNKTEMKRVRALMEDDPDNPNGHWECTVMGLVYE